MQGNTPTAALVGATLASLARLEAADEKPARLTDPTHARWKRFARALGWADCVRLLHEDAASNFVEPFDLRRWASVPLDLDDTTAELVIRRNQQPSTLAPNDFLREQANALGLHAGGAFSELPKLEPRHRILELPGSGGRVAAYLAITDERLSLANQFTFIAATPAERVAIGLAVVETRANAPTIWSLEEAEAALPKARFDRALGLRGAPLAAEWAARLEASVEVRLV